VLYVGKAKNIRKRIIAYTRPTGYDPRIERMIAATAALEFVSTATETEALLLEANLIKRLRPRFNVLLRDDKSFPYILITADHWAPQILKHRGARSRDGNYYGPFASVWAVNRTYHAPAARVPAALLLRWIFREPHPAVPALPDQDDAPALHARDRFRGIQRARARSQRVPVGQEPGGEGAAGGRNGESLHRARLRTRRHYRDRLAALSAVQSHQDINPRGVEEADVFAVHQAGGFNCVQVFFFRTGQNWGNRAYFPRPTVRSRPARCWVRSSPNSTTTSPARAASSSRTRSRSARCWPKP
jgi:excinuclease ABC subunit C